LTTSVVQYVAKNLEHYCYKNSRKVGNHNKEINLTLVTHASP